MNREVAQEQFLRDVFRLLRRQKWVILATVVVAVGAAIAYAALKTPEYQATSKIQFVDQSQQLATIGISESFTGLTPAQQASQGAERVTSPSVVNAVAKDVKSDLSNSEVKDAVTTSVNPDNALVSLTVTADKAKLAADLANAYADETKAVLTDDERSTLLKQAKGIAKQAKDLDDTSIQKSTLLQKVAQLRSAAKVVAPVEVANTATEPSSPSSPQPVKDGILALFLGLIFGVVLAFLRDSLDRRLTDPADIQHQLQMPMVGYVDDSALGGIGFARNGSKPSDHGLEPFRILRSNVEFLAADKPVRTLAVTSPVAEEGKSTVAAGLATAAAFADKRVLLVECDLRRPVFADRFDIEPAPGLTDWATGNADPRDVIQAVSVERDGGKDAGEERTDGSQSLTVISAGSYSARPAELLASRRFKEFVGQVSEVYDLVVFDCAPLLPVGDALEVLPLADAALLCIRVDKTTREQALAAKGAIEHLPDRPIGLVLTGVRSGREGYYYGYYPSTPSRPAIVVQPPSSG
jgi:capsular exopolysaccharide synthesis family protein